MTRRILQFGLSALLATSMSCLAQLPAGAPANATGRCKDGSYTTIPNKAKACSGHQGVKAWYQTVGGPDDPNLKGGTGKQSANANGVVDPHANSAEMSTQRAHAINKESGNEAVATPNNGGKTIPGPAANKTAAPGGGPGMVWVNTDTKVYHCYGSQFYGKTKDGKYVSEQDAIKMGAKANHGKACSK